MELPVKLDGQEVGEIDAEFDNNYVLRSLDAAALLAFINPVVTPAKAAAAALSAQGIKPRIMRRPNKHHPVLPPRLQRLNRLIARRRAAVETTFAVFKQHMGVRRARYLGLAKTTGQMLLVALAFNLRKAATLAM